MCTGFLFVLCITGLPLIFSEEIEAAAGSPAIAAGEAADQGMTLDHIVAQVRAAHPGAFIQFVFWDDRPEIVGVGLANRPKAHLEDVRRLRFNLSTRRQLPEQPPSSSVMQAILSLHKSLLIGGTGEIILAGVGTLFLLSLISGGVLYAPFLRRRSFGAVDQGGPKRRWLDLHNLIGIAIGIWLLVIGATGVMNALEAPLFAAWEATTMPGLLAPSDTRPLPRSLVSVDAAVESARTALPGMRPTSVGFPQTLFGSPRHYLIWMKGDKPLTAHFFVPVLVDARTGMLRAVVPMPWYLRALEISRPLHFGDYGGLPLKILWALLDLVAIVVLGSGLYLWFSRHRSPIRAQIADLSRR